MSKPEFVFDRIIISLVEGLGHPYRYFILETLINTDKKDGFSMKELQLATGLNVTTLHTHLNHLIAHSLVNRSETLKNLGEANSIGYYKISDLGTKFVNALVSVLEVPEKI